jgi:GH25 family lysozyme M1 (1,4-beta-N-acetylmuramidase)
MTTASLPRGIDVSNHQQVVAWSQVAAAGYRFAFAKASEGTYFNDRYFAGNWSGIKAAGLYRGAYHFARPSSGTPDAEAAFFLAAVTRAGGLETGDMLVLDLEDEQYHGGGPYGSAGAWALGFCQYIEAAVGFAPLIYWATWYRPADIAATPELGKYPLWLAAYRATMPPAPAPWEVISFWQFTSSAGVPGVSGPCDANVFNGAADRIPLLGKPGAVDPVDPMPAIRAHLLTARDEIDAALALTEL